MNKRIIFLGMTAVAFLSAATPDTNTPDPKSPDAKRIIDPKEIWDLSLCVDQRFLGPVIRTFGMSRMGSRPPIHGPHDDTRNFISENPAEQSLIDAFHAKGYEVLFYLAGRRILEKKPAHTAIGYRYGIQGPALITDKVLPDDAPSKPWLLGESRIALKTYDDLRWYPASQHGTWTITLRPLRADSSSCVKCHTSSTHKVEIDDTIGVAIYAYRQIDSAKRTGSSK